MSKQASTPHTEPTVQEALSKSEQFFHRHKNHILYGLIALVVIVGGGFAYHKLYREPLKEEAMGQMFIAEQYFRVDSFAIALKGDGNALGFNQIQDEYGSLAGPALNFYIGICHLQLGEYQNAIDALNKYNTKDFVMQARAYSCIGDAYVGLNNLDKALDYFLKAANHNENLLASAYLKKAGIIYEEQGKNDQAIKIYQDIKDKYPQTLEGYEADKYIVRLQAAQ